MACVQVPGDGGLVGIMKSRVVCCGKEVTIEKSKMKMNFAK